jgi:hypothetical protein
MKKTAILSIAAFYLLLTTGMFVCLIHCAGESVFQPKMVMQAMNHATHHGKHHQHNTKDKDCDCCNKHSNYVIKENIKPATVDVQAPQLAALPRQFNYVPVTDAYTALNILPLPYGKAPPGISGKALSIQLRSLQI